MNTRLAVTAIALLFTLFTQPQFAQQAKKPTDAQAKSSVDAGAVDQIINKYVQAIGGAASNQKLNTRVLKGTIVINHTQNLSGDLEAYCKAPNKSLVLIKFPEGVVREGYDGEIAWAHDPQDGVRVMTGAELASARVDSDFYKDIRLREVFPKLVFKGTEKVGDILTHKLEGVSKDGYSETMYFAVENGLLVRTDSIVESPSGKTVMELHHEDYREVDGVKIPFVMRHRSPKLNIVFKIIEVKHNVPIEDGMFEKPKN